MSNNTKRRKIDIYQLLRRRRQVAIIWGTDDIRSRRPDLAADQAWKVLQVCERVHDDNSGFTWDLIERVADELFPQ